MESNAIALAGYVYTDGRWWKVGEPVMETAIIGLLNRLEEAHTVIERMDRDMKKMTQDVKREPSPAVEQCEYRDRVGQRCLRPAGHDGIRTLLDGHDFGGVTFDAKTSAEWHALRETKT